jgi:flagellar motility protein MotE (MotC chaperone)
MICLRAAVLGALLAGADGVSAGLRSKVQVTNRANPIRRVVTLLQKMQDQVAAEGKKEEELYEKFMCYCTTGKQQLETSITDAEERTAKVTAAIEEGESRKAQLDADVKKAKKNRKEGMEALAKAKELRKKEATAFAKLSGDLRTNISALAAAIQAIEKGMEGSFLQSAAATALKRLAVDADMASSDREALTAFLSDSSSEGYAPQSGQILGILKQMSDTMSKELVLATETEHKAQAEFEELVAAKTAEVEALTQEIESKLEAAGQLAVEITNMKEDVDDTLKALKEDKVFLAELEKGCGSKKAEWEERQKLRAEEMLAIHETIKILNNDDALELFKKTLPSPTLLQVQVTGKEMQKTALKELGHAKSKDYRVALIAMTLRGGVKSFEKVIKLIDDMVVLLGEEQKADDQKKEYCEKSLDTAEDEKKVLENTHSDLEKSIDDAKETISVLGEEIEKLLKGIKDLDNQVKEATEQREEDNAFYKKTMQEDTATKEILKMAKNRLAKFYAPKLYKPPAQAEKSAMGKVASDFDVALAQANPGPPPETWGAYAKMGEESGGVVAMLDILIGDLDKEMTEMKTQEADDQKEYEEFVTEAAAKRTADSKSVAQKTGEKAEAEAGLVKLEQDLKDTTKDLYLKEKQIKELHVECDWLLSNFDVRKEARAGEVDSLEKAKAVLSGADYSLMQTRERHTVLRAH